MNTYDHEDAFKDANRHAGKVISLPDALKLVRDKDHARLLLIDLQDQYEKLFEAFIAGVAWARNEDKLNWREPDIKALVDRFLGWKLPASVRPDPYPPESPHAHGNSGTNLLTADEAEQMFRYVLAKDDGRLKK